MANSIMDKLASMSKEELLHNCAREISKMQEQNLLLKQTISEREETITNLQTTLSNMQSQAQLDQSVADRLIQLSRNEAQNIVDTANKKASATTKQANDLLAHANAELTKKIAEANEQANRIISNADTQASALIESRIRTAKDNLDAIRGTKSALVENLNQTLNGIITECDLITPKITTSLDDITALRQTSMGALHDLETETYPEKTSEQELQKQEIPNISNEDMHILDGVFGNTDNNIFVPERKTKSKAPVVRRGNITNSNQTDQQQANLQKSVQQASKIPYDDLDDDLDDDFDVIDDNSPKQYKTNNDLNEDSEFDPDSAKSFTSEFLSLNTGDIATYDNDNEHDDDFDVSASSSTLSTNNKRQSQTTKQNNTVKQPSKRYKKSGNKKTSQWY